MELFRSLAVLAEPPGPETERLAELLDLPRAPAAWEFTDLFVEQLYPYASVYLGPEGKLGGAARGLIAGFWRALGQTPPAEPDHLSLLLGLYAHLRDLQDAAQEGPAREAWRRARTALLWEHLLSWLPSWLGKLQQIGPEPYRAWGDLLAEALAGEAGALLLPHELPLHLQDAPELEAPGPGGGARFLEQLLAPVCTGFILTRTDLARAADDLRLGLRAGERRYALEALLSQDAAAVLGWLAAEAESVPPVARLGGIASEFWQRRAERAAQVLAQAAAVAATDR